MTVVKFRHDVWIALQIKDMHAYFKQKQALELTIVAPASPSPSDNKAEENSLAVHNGGKASLPNKLQQNTHMSIARSPGGLDMHAAKERSTIISV